MRSSTRSRGRATCRCCRSGEAGPWRECREPARLSYSPCPAARPEWFEAMSENTSFIYATGIENSNPSISGGRVRVDELEKCGHYRHWRTDFALVRDLGIRFLRYGPPLHKTYLGPGRYDWEFTDLAF